MVASSDANDRREPTVGALAPTGNAWLSEAGGRRHYLTPSLTMIGRSAPSQIALGADPFLSRRHAAIQLQDQAFWFLDLESANGSFINQRPAVGPQRLVAGDVIQVGMTSLLFETAPHNAQDPR